MEKNISAGGHTLLVDVGKYLIVAFVLVIFTTIVGDVFAYGYAAHFLDLPIVLAHAKPSATVLGVSALWVILANLVLELIPRLRPLAIARRTYNEGLLQALGGGTPRTMIVALLTIYLVVPAALGQIIALSQMSFRVMRLANLEVISAPGAIPRRVANDSVIVARTGRGGVLLAVYDRSRNAVISNLEFVNEFGPNEPKLYTIEKLGHIGRVSK